MKAIEAPDCAECSCRINSVFGEITLEALSGLNGRKSMIGFNKGEEIFQQDSYPLGVYCVFSGKVRITQKTVSGDTLVLRVASEGDIMGYRAVIGNDKFSCSAIAESDVTVCFLPKSEFMRMVQTDHKFSQRIMKLFSDELKCLEDKLTKSTKRTVKEKTAQAILFLIENYGFEADNETLNLNITREEMAQIVGSTRETVTRVLYQFADESLISLKGKKIKVIKQKALAQMADPDF